MSVTTIPAEPGWRLVVTRRPEGGGDIRTWLMPVIAWHFPYDDNDGFIGDPAATVVWHDGRARVVGPGRYVNAIAQPDASYTRTIRAALDDYREGEAADLAAWVSASRTGPGEGDHPGPASPVTYRPYQRVESDALMDNSMTGGARPAGAPDLSQQTEREAAP